MTSILPITMIGEQSPNFDLEQFSLPPNMMSYANNYVIRDNKYLSFKTYDSISTSVDIPNNPGYIDFVDNSSNQDIFLVAGATQIKSYDAVNWVDISNPLGYAGLADSSLWNGCKLGSIPVITNYDVYPEYWSPQLSTQVMQDLKFDATTTWRAKNFKCKIIRSHLNFLFALGLKEGSVEQPNAYRWSHPADIGGLPFSWDELDVSTIASKQMIDDEYILDGISCRNEFAIYTNRGIHFLTYTGNTEMPFTRRKLSITQSLLATRCVVEVLGGNYFLANSDILYTDGSNVTSVLDKRAKNLLRNTLSSDFYSRCFATVNSNAKEVWFFIVQDGFSYPNMAIIINYIDKNISVRQINDFRHACFGVRLNAAQFFNSVLPSTTTFNDYPGELGGDVSSPFNYKIIGIKPGELLSPDIVDRIDSQNLGLVTVYERTNLVLDNDIENATTITRFTPRLKTSGAVKIELGSHDYVGSPVRWKPAIVYQKGITRKIDVRTTGKLHAWRVSSMGNDYVNLEGFDIIYEKAGERIGGFIPVVAR